MYSGKANLPIENQEIRKEYLYAILFLKRLHYEFFIGVPIACGGVWCPEFAVFTKESFYKSFSYIASPPSDNRFQH